jgi:L-amino acid N-acyltransferase YncA
MDSATFRVRRAELQDSAALQRILNEVIEEGTSFLAEAAKSLDETTTMWLEDPAETYVACDPANGEIMGAYLIKPNASGRGSHVANATYMVKRSHRGKGVGQFLGLHSLAQARRNGYRAMQFNAVVSVNTAAVAL